MADKHDIEILNTLDQNQRSEILALGDGRWAGDPLPVLDLRERGIQDDGLGLTPLGERLRNLIELDYRERDRLGIKFRWV